MYCRECGAKTRENAAYCGECGAKIRENIETKKEAEREITARMKKLRTLKEQLRCGASIKFGSYEQGNGIKPIEWRVLERSEKEILLITKNVVDCKEYNERLKRITWERSDLRKWLNNDFSNVAFDEIERELIAETLCSADKNPEFPTTPGNATTDKIFLLSISEVEKYFRSDEDRLAVPTAYAKKTAIYTYKNYKEVSGKPYCWWWLRSPGFYGDSVVAVNDDGSIYYHGHCASRSDGGVRPAMRINLEL